MSGKPQIQKGYRKLDPGFQYLLKVMEDTGAKLDSTKPAELRKEFEEQEFTFRFAFRHKNY